MPAELLERPATVEDVAREISKIRSIVTDAVEDGLHTARQAIKRGRHVAEDAIQEAEHKVKQRPLEAVGAAFAAGFLIGGLLTWIGFRRR